MAHEIEHRADRGTDSFAFVGERSAIWHGLGQQAMPNWTAEEWMAASNQDFRVSKVPLVGVQAGEGNPIPCDEHMMLIREDSGKFLSIVSPEWQPSQNEDAYAFAEPMIAAGLADFNTAGTLFEGRICFLLLKTNDGFQLPGADENEMYIFVQISHQYGHADMAVPLYIRVVCDNTRRAGLSSKTKSQLDAGKFIHRAKTAFSVEKAQSLIEAYRLGLAEYAEQAKFLSTKRATPEQVRAYINKVFKLEALTKGTREEIARRHENNERTVKSMLKTIDTQPGAHMSAGSWWSVYNGVTFHEDHGKYLGKTEALSTKISGSSNERKQAALQVALAMAN